jgi:hypothetical protein
MPEDRTDIRVKGKVSNDHTLTAVVPDDIPPGEVDVVIEVRSRKLSRSERVEALQRIFDEFDKLDFPRRSKEEIDTDLAAERASWDE